jgi:hypothetical protein
MTFTIVRKAVAVAAVSVLALAMAGCALPSVGQQEAPVEPTLGEAASSQAALDAYVALERAAIPSIFESTGDVYTDITIDPEYPATIVYTYTYAETLDPVASAAYFDEQIPTLQDVCESAVFPAMAFSGVEGTRHATFVYLNPDGSTIWTYTFSSS